MNNLAFINAYDAGRNGTDNFYAHSLVRNFHYSDGVRDCAKAGCYWLLDVLATEATAPLRASGDHLGTIAVTVHDDESARIEMFVNDGTERGRRAWLKKVGYTDMPVGTWLFYLADEGSRFALILPSEY